jgi:hypothetical protein
MFNHTSTTTAAGTSRARAEPLFSASVRPVESATGSALRRPFDPSWSNRALISDLVRSSSSLCGVATVLISCFPQDSFVAENKVLRESIKLLSEEHAAELAQVRAEHSTAVTTHAQQQQAFAQQHSETLAATQKQSAHELEQAQQAVQHEGRAKEQALLKVAEWETRFLSQTAEHKVRLSVVWAGGGFCMCSFCFLQVEIGRLNEDWMVRPGLTSTCWS